jgi:hypothetical protein
MRHLFKFVGILAVMAALAVVAYAYFGDMSAIRSPVEQPVTLPQQ